MMNRDADKTVRDIRRATRRKFSAEEKVRIVLEGSESQNEPDENICSHASLLILCD